MGMGIIGIGEAIRAKLVHSNLLILAYHIRLNSP